MSAYLICQVEIHDVEVYRQYTIKSPAIIAAHGGKILVRGGATVTIEGTENNRRIVVVEFPSMDAALAFYNSPEYQAAKLIRAPASDAQFLIAQGVE